MDIRLSNRSRCTSLPILDSVEHKEDLDIINDEDFVHAIDILLENFAVHESITILFKSKPLPTEEEEDEEDNRIKKEDHATVISRVTLLPLTITRCFLSTYEHPELANMDLSIEVDDKSFEQMCDDPNITIRYSILNNTIVTDDEIEARRLMLQRVNEKHQEEIKSIRHEMKMVDTTFQQRQEPQQPQDPLDDGRRHEKEKENLSPSDPADTCRGIFVVSIVSTIAVGTMMVALQPLFITMF